MKHKIKIFWIGMPQHKIALTDQLNHMIRHIPQTQTSFHDNQIFTMPAKFKNGVISKLSLSNGFLHKYLKFETLLLTEK